MKDKAKDCTYFSLALNESSDARDTAQWLIFLRGITPDVEITEEFASVQSMKSTTTGKYLLEEVNKCVEKLGLSFEKLSSVTVDGCQNIGLLKRIQDQVAELNPDKKMIFLHCIIYQEVLWKCVLEMSHVVDTVTKVVNFIRAKSLNHRQVVSPF